MTPEQIKHLWRLLGQTYGHKFADQYGPTPNEAWTAALMTLSPSRVKHALGEAIRSGSPFVPTLPEFVKMAREYREPQVETGAVRKLTHVSELPEETRTRLRRQMYHSLYGDRLPDHVEQRLASDAADPLGEIRDAIRKSVE